MDILREVTESELNYVIDRMKESLPRNIKNINYILSAQRSKNLSKNFDGLSGKVTPAFYTHRKGLKENCTIFGITSEADHTVWFFTLQESLDEVRECLENTKRIHYDQKLLFVTIHKEQTLVLLDFLEKKDDILVDDENAACYMLEKEEALKFEISVPDEVDVRTLIESDSVSCNNMWEWRCEKSEKFIKSLICLNGGFGLIDKQTDELLSFATINDHLAIGILNTIPKARGKGYGELIVKLLAKRIAEEFNINPTCYINNRNVASMKLFGKLGFLKICHCNWIMVDGTRK